MGTPGPILHVEVICDAVTYVYAHLVETVHAEEVIFDLNSEDLVCTRKAH